MVIKVEHLRKDFAARRRLEKRGWFARYEAVTVPAVRDISFEIQAGECVAFIGPNGAGKSTTLKMLSGILEPSGGHAEVAGFTPWRQRQALAYEIGLVFGQRSQLWHHLPVRQSFDLLGSIYGVEGKDYAAQLARLEAVFQLAAFLDQPAKSLSLGQRMRCEIAASLIHKPKILFLDEPTIGLDITAKAELRDHLRGLSRADGTTIILTSHDTDDIEEICRRVILINHGRKLIDMPLTDMRRQYLSRRQVSFVTAEENPALVLPRDAAMHAGKHRLTVEIDPALTPVAAIIGAALAQLTVHDIAVSDVALEDVIKHIYAEGAA